MKSALSCTTFILLILTSLSLQASKICTVITPSSGDASHHVAICPSIVNGYEVFSVEVCRNSKCELLAKNISIQKVANQEELRTLSISSLAAVAVVATYISGGKVVETGGKVFSRTSATGIQKFINILKHDWKDIKYIFSSYFSKSKILYSTELGEMMELSIGDLWWVTNPLSNPAIVGYGGGGATLSSTLVATGVITPATMAYNWDSIKDYFSTAKDYVVSFGERVGTMDIIEDIANGKNRLPIVRIKGDFSHFTKAVESIFKGK